MSKSKVYKKKRQTKGNIFVILVVVLIALIVVAVVVTSVDNSKYNGLMKDYTEFAYGERQNIKLQRIAGLEMEAYANEEYAYYPDDNIIYDTVKNVADYEVFKTKSEAAASILGTISQAEFYTYTDGSDFSIDYDYVIANATSTEIVGGEDAAAQKFYDYVVALGEEYNICGLYLTLTDSEYYYGTFVDVMKKETVTLDMIKENLSATELKLEVEPTTEGDAEAEEAPAEDAE